MTREEAIEQLRNLSQANFYPRTIMALDMAIEALLILGEDGIVNCCGCIHWGKEGFCKVTDRHRWDFDYCSDGRREP